jgi:inorganic pyrophosphatase/exopolyphosphatase
MFCIFKKDKKQMKLSKNFTLTEFEKSQTAIRQGLDNSMPEEHLENAKALCENVLQKVRILDLSLLIVDIVGKHLIKQ